MSRGGFAVLDSNQKGKTVSLCAMEDVLMVLVLHLISVSAIKGTRELHVSTMSVSSCVDILVSVTQLLEGVVVIKGTQETSVK